MLTAIQVRGGPNIVQLLGVYEEPATGHIITEHMAGGNLVHWARSPTVAQKFSESLVRNVMRGVLTGLDYLHEK